MSFKDILNSIFGRKKEVVMPLDPELIKRDEVIKALVQQRTARDAQLAKVLTEEHAKREEEKKKDREKILAQRLQERLKEIKKKSFGDVASLRNLFVQLYENKKLKIEMTDKESRETIGIFYDIGITEDGSLLLLNEKGTIMARGKQMNQIIYKPGSLFNYIKRKQMPVPYILDEEGKMHYIPDLENLEMPTISYNKEDKIYEMSEELQEKLKTQLIKKEEMIRKLRRDIERTEAVSLDLKAELDDMKRASRALENQTDNYQTQLSKVMDRSMQFETRAADMQRQITILTEMKANYESIIQRVENINEQLLAKMEQMGIRTDFEKAMLAITDLIDWAKDKMPQQLIQRIEPERKESPTIQPGQPLGGASQAQIA